MKEQSAACAEITRMTAETCVELLHDYGVRLTPTSLGWTSGTPDRVLFGVMGFFGTGLRATCLLGAEQRLVEASSRSASGGRDWIAELANQLIGRLKIKLLAYGLTVTMTTPLALSGVQFRPLPREGQKPLEFKSDVGSALIWLELETDESLVLDAERPLSVVQDDVMF